MLSLGVMIYLVARKVPQIIDVIDENPAGSRKLFAKIENFIDSLPAEKVDFFVSQLLEKMFRKLKLFSMKLDNQLAHHLKKFKSKTAANVEGNKPTIFEKNENDGNVDEEKFEVEKNNSDNKDE